MEVGPFIVRKLARDGDAKLVFEVESPWRCVFELGPAEWMSEMTVEPATAAPTYAEA